MARRQPLHNCPDCGTTIGAMKQRCAPCSDEHMRKQSLLRHKKRRERNRQLKNSQ